MEGLLTTTQAAEYLGYSEYTLRASRSRGKLSGYKAPKYIKLGTTTIRYKKADLDEWVEGASKE